MPKTASRVVHSVTILAFLLAFPGSLAADPRDDLLAARALPAREAVAHLEKALPRAGELQPWYLLELARLEGEQGNWSKSLSWSSRQTAAPEEIADQAARWHGEALYKLGKTGEARAILKSRLDSGKTADPQVYLSWFRVADEGTAARLSSFDAAFPSLRQTDPAAWALSRYLSGLSAVREGDWKQAVDSLSRFTPDQEAGFPDLAPWSRYYLAYSQYRLGLWADSVRTFTGYLDGWNSHPLSWQGATTAALAAVQAGIDPLPLAERAVRLAPSGPEIAESSLLKASILIDKKKYAPAGEVLSGVADGSATRGRTALAPRAWFMYGEIAARQNKPALAEERWLRVHADFPKDPLAEEAFFRAGENWFVAGDFRKAVALFEKYRKTWPSGRYLEPVLRLGGESLGSSGNPDLGILWLEECVRKFPKGSAAPQSYRILIRLAKEKGEYAAALAHARAYQSAWSEEARLDDMEREIEELSSLSKGLSPDVASLHSAYLRSGRASTAEGRSAGLRLARVWLADWNKRSEALDLLREITSRSPSSFDSLSRNDRSIFGTAWTLLASALRENASFREASSAFLSAGGIFSSLDAERSAEALYGAVDSFLQSGQTGDAEKTLATMEKKWPDSLWTRRASLLLE